MQNKAVIATMHEGWVVSDGCLGAGQEGRGASAFTGLKCIDGFSSQLIDPFSHLLIPS